MTNNDIDNFLNDIDDEETFLHECDILESLATSSQGGKDTLELRHGASDCEGRVSTAAITLSDVAAPSTSYNGRSARKNRSKKQKVAINEEEDILVKYIKRSDAKYAFNKKDRAYPPLVSLRHGHLAVTDITATMWCEQQWVYHRCVPAVVRRKHVPDPEYVAAGKTLHRERELEIQTYVKVETVSDEDIFAVQYSNTLHFVRQLLRQKRPVVREVHVLGEVDGVLITGIIDELRVAEGNDFAIDLVEFKTRTSRTIPGKAQKLTHDMQVMLYKYMFDDMIRGRCFDKHFRNFGLHLDIPLGKSVATSIQKHCTKGGGVPFTDGDCWSIRRLFAELRCVMEALPFIRSCSVSYTYQEDGLLFHEEHVPYDEPWLVNRLSHSLAFWRGERSSEGVDVEDAWKCSYCAYKDHCWWRQQQAQRLQQYPAAVTDHATNEEECGVSTT